MKTILHYLKQHLFSVAAIFVLLFTLAQFDLLLPEYMSKIINNGISNYGIEEVVPLALSQTDYQIYELIDKDIVSLSYSKVSINDASDKTIKTYPLIKTEDIYLRVAPKDKTHLESLKKSTGLYGMLISNPGVKDTFLTSTPAIQAGMIASLDLAYSSQNKMIQDALLPIAIKDNYTNLSVNLVSKQNAYLVSISSTMLLIALGAACIAISNNTLSARLGSKIGYSMRKDVFKKVQNLSASELEQFSTASLITRTTNDAMTIQQTLAMSTRMIIYSPILAISGIIKIVNSSHDLSFILGISIGVMFALIIVLFIFGLPKFTKIQKLLDKINLVVREILTGQLVIRAFSTQNFHDERFDNANKDFAKNNRFIQRLMALMQPMMGMIFNGAVVAIFWFGGKSIEAGNFQVGDMMAFMQYTIQILMAFLMMTFMFVMLPQAIISANRIQEVLSKPTSVPEPSTPKVNNSNVSGILAFNQVTFQYPDAQTPILSNISFATKPGKTTAIIGSTGSGKSTIINLIPRFYDRTAGEITLDNIDIKDYALTDLHSRIGFVFQKAFLFSGTIRSNMLYGNPKASDEEIYKALEIAQFTSFFDEHPEKLDYPVDKGGSNFSGGQKQRLAIARALVTKPEIYVFDDTFSALDYKTDAKLRKTIAKKIQEDHASVLLIAQRISTIMTADNIVVLDHGIIVGQGTHQELLANCRIYQEIASSQLSKEELDHAIDA